MATDPVILDEWHTIPLNPEPWAIGPVSAGRGRGGGIFAKVGANAQLVAFQKAVKEAITDSDIILQFNVQLTFYFWRHLARYDKDGRTVQKHQVDATNMQKGLEDALQGVLFANDNQVRDIRSVVVDQGPDVEPMIALKISIWDGFDTDEIPNDIWNEMSKYDHKTTVQELADANVWPPLRSV